MADYSFRPIRRVSLNPCRKYFSILLADDGSPDVLAAVDFLVDLPLYDCTVTVLSVVSQREASSLALREACLDQTRARLEQAELCARTVLKMGSPAEVILQVAEELTPDLVLMGAAGLNHAFGITLGGVTEKVVEQIRVPILIYRRLDRSLRKIGFFTDGSTQAEYAAEYLAQFPLPDRAEIHLVHVLPTLAMQPVDWKALRSPSPNGNGKVREVVLRDADRILCKASLILQKHELPIRAVLLHGEPCEQVREYAVREELDLIVLGARGLSKGPLWELGSLPRKLLHYCPCPILIVKEKLGLITRN